MKEKKFEMGCPSLGMKELCFSLASQTCSIFPEKNITVQAAMVSGR
jgi:hypothetical protein